MPVIEGLLLIDPEELVESDAQGLLEVLRDVPLDTDAAGETDDDALWELLRDAETETLVLRELRNVADEDLLADAHLEGVIDGDKELDDEGDARDDMEGRVALARALPELLSVVDGELLEDTQEDVLADSEVDSVVVGDRLDDRVADCEGVEQALLELQGEADGDRLAD